jgi:hypothetical protein
MREVIAVESWPSARDGLQIDTRCERKRVERLAQIVEANV